MSLQVWEYWNCSSMRLMGRAFCHVCMKAHGVITGHRCILMANQNSIRKILWRKMLVNTILDKLLIFLIASTEQNAYLHIIKSAWSMTTYSLPFHTYVIQFQETFERKYEKNTLTVQLLSYLCYFYSLRRPSRCRPPHSQN